MYHIGHQRDQKTKLVGVKDFTPPLLGKTKIAQFKITSWFGSGAYLIGAAVALQLGAAWMSRVPVHCKASGSGSGLVSVCRAGAGFVAQICNLLYRRLAVGKAWHRSHASAFSNGQQSATLRYSRVQLCATPGPNQVSGLSPRENSDSECAAALAAARSDKAVETASQPLRSTSTGLKSGANANRSLRSLGDNHIKPARA